MPKNLLDTEKPLIVSFLQTLNIARRNLSIYPPEHPRIAESISSTMEILQELFLTAKTIAIGIGPRAIYFEQVRFDNEDPAVRDFSGFFSGLGIATVSFLDGVRGDELIRFNHLLRSRRAEIEEFGGFETLLEQQRITHIRVQPVDYEAFQARALDRQNNEVRDNDLWESFLHGLTAGILDFEGTTAENNLNNLARLLNQAQATEAGQAKEYQEKLTDFVARSLYSGQSQQLQVRAGNSINQLLAQLSPEAREHFLTRILQALNQNPEPARNILSGISPQYFTEPLARLSRDKQVISSRLVDLLDYFSKNTAGEARPKSPSGTLPGEVVRARLQELFREEQQEAFLPDNYQSALADVFSDKVTPSLIPEEVRAELRLLVEQQSVEEHLTAIIFEFLEHDLAPEHEAAIQDHLLELSRFYLDTGDFGRLQAIYQRWRSYLNSGQSRIDLFAERILAAHTQKSFIAEVLDGFELWDEEQHPDLTAYIATVGEPYCEPVIERLGLAPTWQERRLWLALLAEIGSDAQEKIMAALKDDRWFLVRNLLSVLGREPNQQTLKASLPFCTHPHPMVRIEAIRNLLRSNPATANRYLLKELDSEEEQTRQAAVRAAALSRDPEIIRFLHSLIQQPPRSDSDLHLQCRAVESLGEIASPETIPVLRRILLKQGLFVPQRVKRLQQEIINVLPLLSGARADKLVAELKNTKFRQQLNDALAKNDGNHHEKN